MTSRTWKLWTRIVLLSVGVLAGFWGCGISASFAPSNNNYARSTRRPDQIELFLGFDLPSRPVSIVGIMTTDWTWHGLNADLNVVLQAMRDEAARNGLDGVLTIWDVPAGMDGQGLCTGKGFVYRQ